MRRTVALVAAIVLLAGNPVGGQPAKPANAKVTIAGHGAGTLTIKEGAKEERFVMLDMDGMTTVKVATNQDMMKFLEQQLAQQQKLFKDYTAVAQKLFANGDMAGLKKAQKDFETASAELQEYGAYYAADGNLVVVNDELRLVGQVRVLAHKGADKALGKGKASVEGEATNINFDAGNGAKMTLAIQNGDSAIAVTGKAAENMGNVKGTIRVVGVLRLTKGGPALEADKIEVLKK
jgi:hypothetical protein